MITFINIPLGVKNSYTNTELDFYRLYRKRYEALLNTETKINSKSTETYAQSEIPYWCLCLASHLKSKGISSKILDYQNQELDDALILNILDLLGTSKLIAISCNTNNYHIACEIMTRLKKINSKLVFIIGGPHATFTFNRCLNDGFDFVVKANGEDAILSLCQNYKRANTIKELKKTVLFTKNLSFLYNSKIINNDADICIKDSFVDVWNKLDYSLYRGNPTTIRLFTSLGCNHQCAFCADTIWNRQKIIFFPTDLIKKHLESLLERFKPKYLLIGDENFLQNKEHFIKVSSILKQKNIPYVCQSRVDSITIEKLLQLKDTGCKLLQLGVESSSDEILNKSKKNLSFSLVKETLMLIKQFDLPVLTYWLVGLPGETKETLRETVDWITYFLKNDLTYLVDYYIFSPYPGTPIFENPDTYEITIRKESDYSKWREDDITVYDLPDLPAEQIYEEWIYGLNKIIQSLKGF